MHIVLTLNKNMKKVFNCLLLMLAGSLNGAAERIDDFTNQVGQIVRIELPYTGANRVLSLAEVQVMSGGINIAYQKTTDQSSTAYGGASFRAVDGDTNQIWTQGTITHTASEENPYWEVDLGKPSVIERIRILTRLDSGNIDGFTLSILDAERNEVYVNEGISSTDIIHFAKKDLGSIWTIGDTMSLGSEDGDDTISPRQALYEQLVADGFEFSFTGHLSTQTDGLPETGGDALTNLYHYHSCIPDVLVGDSTMAGFRDQLTTAWDSGRLASVKPKHIFIMLGSEDVKTSYDLDNASVRVEALINEIYALPGIGRPKIYLSAIPPNRRVEAERTNAILWNGQLEDVVATFNTLGNDNVLYVDAYTPLDEVFETSIGDDNYYPTASGSTLIGQTWYTGFKDEHLKVSLGDIPDEFPGRVSLDNGFNRYVVPVPGGQTITIVAPNNPLPHKPWLWRNVFWDAIHRFKQNDLRLVEDGYYLVIASGNLMGHPSGNAAMDIVYDYLTQEHGFSPKTSAAAMSRGNLMMFRWAWANPDKIDSLYSDNGVLNVLSWPAGTNAVGNDSTSAGDAGSWEYFKDTFGYTSDAEALLTKESPIDLLEPLAAAGVPILSICGALDNAVPYEENDKILEERYLALGGDITVVVENKGHSHGTNDYELFANFTKQHTSVVDTGNVKIIDPTDVRVDSFSASAEFVLPDGDYTVEAYIGTTDGGQDAASWDTVESSVAWSSDDSVIYNHTFTGLTQASTYYYTFKVSGDIGDVWASTGVITTLDTPLTGAIGQWNFDYNSGATAIDYSSSGNTATITDAALVDGVYGNALDFAAAGTSKMDIPSTTFSSITDQITLAMWVYGADSQPTWGTLFKALDASAGTVINLQLPYWNENVFWDAGGDRLSYYASESEYKGKWNHWVFTKNVTTGEMSIYVNAELVATATGKTGALGTITEAALGYQSYKGAIDDFTVFNVAYSAEQVQTLYDSYLLSESVPMSWLADNGLSRDDATLYLDPDFDGLLNWQEYRAGTDPNAGTSRLKLKGVRRNGGNIDVTLDTVAGKTYTLWVSSDLGGDDWEIAQSAIEAVDVETVVSLVSADQRLFYRLEVNE